MEVNKKSEKPFDLGERTFLFARRILEICEKLPKGPECWDIRRQLCRSGTSIGANYEEGNGALTKKEKRKSFSVSRKEAREARYWLRLLSGKYLDEEETDEDIREAGELVSIFSKIIDKLS